MSVFLGFRIRTYVNESCVQTVFPFWHLSPYGFSENKEFVIMRNVILDFIRKDFLSDLADTFRYIGIPRSIY